MGLWQTCRQNGARFRCGVLSGWLMVCLTVLAGCGAPVESPVQSPARPHDLPIYDTVKMAGSDGKSARFQRDALPELILMASETFTRENIEENFAELELDPQRLVVTETTNVRVYVVGTTAGWKNAAGINLSGVGIADGEPELLFPEVSCAIRLHEAAELIEGEPRALPMEPFGERTEEHPLHPGDFVELGRLDAGTHLNFFLVAGDGNIYTPVPEANPDGIPHMVALALEDSPYLVISFEDLYGGGDRDFSDCVLAVEMSRYNIEVLLGRIDPWRRAKQLGLVIAIIGLVFGGPLGYLSWRTYRRFKRLRNAAKQASALLDAGDADGAFEITRDVHRHYGNSVTPEFTSVEVDVCTRLSDIGSLTRLYNDSANVFAEKEDASLLVGQARLAEGRTDRYGEVRDLWRNRETHPGAWLGLDADAIALEDKPEQARALLQHQRFEGPEDSFRLARLARFTAPRNPEEARKMADSARELNPNSPEIHRFTGETLEILGEYDDARAAFEQAVRLAPRNPLLRDALGEFHRKRGDYAAAIAVWTKALEHTAAGALWLKALFWRRVARPMDIAFDRLAIPEDELEPLVRFFISLPPSCFWVDAAFAPIADEYPGLAERQEVFWLRLLQALKTNREPEALTILNLSRFAARSWQPQLESALPRMLTYRRLKFMDPSLPSATVDDSAARHPLFETLDAWAHGTVAPEPIQRLIRSDSAFAAACLAAGWHEAGLMLLPAAVFQGEWPPWFLRDVFEALRTCRGENKAIEFRRQHPFPTT